MRILSSKKAALNHIDPSILIEPVPLWKQLGSAFAVVWGLGVAGLAQRSTSRLAVANFATASTWNVIFPMLSDLSKTSYVFDKLHFTEYHAALGLN